MFFLIDAFYNEYYYFPRIIILLIIPLIVKVIIFMHGRSAREMFRVLQKNYDVLYIQTNIKPKQWVIYF